MILMLIILILALFIFATIICLINHTYHPANEQSLFNIIYDSADNLNAKQNDIPKSNIKYKR